MGIHGRKSLSRVTDRGGASGIVESVENFQSPTFRRMPQHCQGVMEHHQRKGSAPSIECSCGVTAMYRRQTVCNLDSLTTGSDHFADRSHRVESSACVGK